jgi:hypothetical protein
MAHEEAAFSSQRSAVSEKQNQHQNQRPFTAEGAEDAEESKTLPESHRKPGDEQERVQDRAQALALKLARTYEELTRLLERNPGMKRQITEGDAKADKVYQKLKQRLSPQPAQNRRGPGTPGLKLADMAPRCRWVRQDGTACRSPQMKQHIYCFAHMQMAEARTLLLLLPPPEDANAIQVGLMRIQKALIEDTISTKKAGLLLYSMQLALTNVGQTTFGQAKDEEMVRDTVDEEDALSEEARCNQHPVFSEKQNQHQHQQQRTFTAKDAEDAKEIGASGHRGIGTSENQNLPRMEADERGLNNGARQIEWSPTPDMYRTDTPEGREAYEACFGTKIKPRVAGEPSPLQGLAQSVAEGYAS